VTTTITMPSFASSSKLSGGSMVNVESITLLCVYLNGESITLHFVYHHAPPRSGGICNPFTELTSLTNYTDSIFEYPFFRGREQNVCSVQKQKYVQHVLVL
jgi:hypothetical protein